ncbi:acetylglutamate kinase [Apibacter adventoris]|uniref:acetylglutamate kinase n=1 Tax=Apibacter adventoris TaxID=1679466 RepID=UPI000CF5DB81|nr:acetylglutamate kinase [Apibacter adventoris]PQL96014.1 acetylglutamate kinase [Apibacter adventoris]
MEKDTLTIIKIGGNVIDNSETLSTFLKNFSQYKGLKILVHGGGKAATRLAGKLGVETIMIEGKRITNEEMLDVAIMTYAGLCNKKIVAQLQNFNIQAIGLTGADGNSILSKKREHTTIDYGYVGDVVEVNAKWIQAIIDTGTTPVFCALTHDKKGQLLNTNADTIAQSLAVGLSSIYNINLIYCFEKKGVLQNMEDEESIIEELNYNTYQYLKNENIIHSGMIPKLDNCFKALKQGVKNIIIANPDIIINPLMLHTHISL